MLLQLHKFLVFALKWTNEKYEKDLKNALNDYFKICRLVTKIRSSIVIRVVIRINSTDWNQMVISTLILVFSSCKYYIHIRDIERN